MFAHSAESRFILSGKKGAVGGVLHQRKFLDVEKDPEKLCNYLVGGNIFKAS